MMDISFKQESDRAGFEKLHPRLYQIIDFIVEYARTVHNQTITVTSIVRNDKSTHDQYPPYRFIDLRLFKDLPIGSSEKLRTIVNLIFPYGLTSKGKPGETIVALDHHDTSPQFTAPHFHVQVSAKWKGVDYS